MCHEPHGGATRWQLAGEGRRRQRRDDDPARGHHSDGGGNGSRVHRASCTGPRIITCDSPRLATLFAGVDPELEKAFPVRGPHGAPLGQTGEATVEVSLNGQDFTSSGLHKFTYYDAAAWRAPSTTAPRGGPTEGGTAVRVEMPGLVRALGDPRCRFGRGHNPTVEATVVGEGTEEAHLLCTSPPLWRRSVRGAPEVTATESLELSVTLNGQDYLDPTTPAATFSYYSLDSPVGLSVKALSPDGGPSVGGTMVTVHGTGFIDHGGLLCLFEGYTPLPFDSEGVGGGRPPGAAAAFTAVPATWENEQTMRCVSPNVTILAHEATDVHRERRGNHQKTLLGHAALRRIDVSINGDAAQGSRASPADFIFYDANELRVSYLYPRGGPADGGTAVTLWGRGFGELDLPHGGGLGCVFGEAPLATARPVQLLTPGYEDAQTLVCYSPPAAATGANAARFESVQVRVTNNGDLAALTTDLVGFTYFEVERGSDVGTSTPEYHVFFPPYRASTFVPTVNKSLAGGASLLGSGAGAGAGPKSRSPGPPLGAGAEPKLRSPGPPVWGSRPASNVPREPR